MYLPKVHYDYDYDFVFFLSKSVLPKSVFFSERVGNADDNDNDDKVDNDGDGDGKSY